MNAITPLTPPASVLDRIRQVNEAAQDQAIPIEQRVALLSSALTEVAYIVALQGKCTAITVTQLKNDNTNLEQSVTNLTAHVDNLEVQLDHLTAEKDKDALIKGWEKTALALNAIVLGPAVYMTIFNPVSAPVNLLLVGACALFEKTTISLRVRQLEKEMNAYLEENPQGKKTDALRHAKRVLRISD